MNQTAKGALLLVLGLITGRLVLNGNYASFVQARMRWPLLIAAGLLLALAAYELWHAWRVEHRNDEHRNDCEHGDHAGEHDSDPQPVDASRPGTGHAHRHGIPAVGWLLVAPLVVLYAVAPTALGAAAAGRTTANLPRAEGISFDPLPAAEPVELRVLEFVQRALYDEQRSLNGRTVRLTGLVVNDPAAPDSFRLTRFVVSCCAADGLPVQVTVHGAGAFPDDTWLTVTGTWRATEFVAVSREKASAPAEVAMDASEVTVLDGPPEHPYEVPY